MLLRLTAEGSAASTPGPGMRPRGDATQRGRNPEGTRRAGPTGAEAAVCCGGGHSVGTAWVRPRLAAHQRGFQVRARNLFEPHFPTMGTTTEAGCGLGGPHALTRHAGHRGKGQCRPVLVQVARPGQKRGSEPPGEGLPHPRAPSEPLFCHPLVSLTFSVGGISCVKPHCHQP